MREIEWSAQADQRVEDFLTLLAEANRAVALRARADIYLRVRRLGNHPLLGRQSAWPGLRVLSLVRWRKIAIYQVFEDRIVVVAFLDARQDLSSLDISPE